MAAAPRGQLAGPEIREAAAFTCASGGAVSARVGRRVGGGRHRGAPVEQGDAQQLLVRARREASRERRVALAERVHRVAIAEGARTPHVVRAGAHWRHEVRPWLVGQQPIVRVSQVSLHHQLRRVASQLE